MLFKTDLCVLSLNIMPPNFARSMVLSGRRISAPKCLTIFLYALVPGCTTLRARTSASTIGTPRDLNNDEAVDLPVAMPPVRPTTNNTIRPQFHLLQ